MGNLLGGQEKFLFDSFAVEMLGLAGAPDVLLYSFKQPTTPGTRDPLYQEAIPQADYIPYKVKAYFERPVEEVSATDEGQDRRTSGKVWFARKDLETAKVSGEPDQAEMDLVKPGDIFELFSRGKNWFFELISVERDGWVNDSQVFTHYSCDFVRNNSFIPERKL